MMLKPFKQKNKKCKFCGNKFSFINTLAQVCSIECAVQYSRDNKVKERVSRELNKLEKAENKKKKESLKTLKQWIVEAQSAVNRYVRARDYYKPCISCNRFVNNKLGGNYDCGHFRTRKSASHLRFNLHNMAKQCVWCNRHRSGAQLEFKEGLIERIGIEKVEAIESNNDIRKFDIGYLKRIKIIFNKKARILEKRIKKCGNPNGDKQK